MLNRVKLLAQLAGTASASHCAGTSAASVAVPAGPYFLTRRDSDCVTVTTSRTVQNDQFFLITYASQFESNMLHLAWALCVTDSHDVSPPLTIRNADADVVQNQGLSL